MNSLDPASTAPLVWETYALDTDVFRPNAEQPPPWGTPQDLPAFCGQSPMAAQFRGSNHGFDTLGRLSEFDGASAAPLAGIAQAFADGAWLTAQNKKLTYYEIRMNEDEFNYIVKNGFYNALTQGRAIAQGNGIGLPAGVTSYGNSGAIEVKAAWLEITDPKLWPQFRMISAVIVDYTQQPPVCRQANMGLVGLHIIHKTPNAQQFAWATFEHVNNAPDANSPPGGVYTYNNPNCNPATDHYMCRNNAQPKPCKTPGQPCDPYTAPVQVFRTNAIPSYVGQLNQYTQQIIAAANPNSVFKYYQLVNVLWPNANKKIPAGAMTPLTDGNPQPPNAQGGLVNTTLETYFQGSTPGNAQLNCLQCHVYGTAAPQQGGRPPSCTVTTINNQRPPGPCASDYSFLFGNATCPSGVNCNAPTVATSRMLLLRSQ